MKNAIFIILISLWHSAMFSQNLISNPGFESKSGCPTVADLSFNATSWRSVLNSPDLLVPPSSCGDYYSLQGGVGNGCPATHTPYSGSSHAGYAGKTSNREFIGTSNEFDLVQGETYEVSFYVKSCSGSINNAEVAITDFSPTSGNVGSIVPSVSLSFTSASNGYSLASGSFLAPTSGKYWLTIGPFTTHTTSGWYLFVDAVSVKHNKCPETRYIQNVTYSNETKIIQAQSNIEIGSNVLPSAPQGDVYFINGSYIVFRAPSINVDVGSVFELGGSYHLLPEMTCSEDPCPSVPMTSDEDFECLQVGQTYESNIGVDPQVEFLYEWSPSTFLDDPHSSNPNVTSTNPQGDITYTCKITSVCGDEYVITKRRVWNTNYGSAPLYLFSSDEDESANQADLVFHVGDNIDQIVVKIIEENKTLYFDGDDVMNGLFSYVLKPNSNCDNRTVEVSAKNVCNDNWVVENYEWINDCKCLKYKFAPNVVVLGAWEENSKFYVQADNAEYFSFNFYEDYDNQYNPIHREGSVNYVNLGGKDMFLVWAPNSSNVGWAYAYRGEIFGCNGQSTGYQDGFVHVYQASNKSSILDENGDEQELSVNFRTVDGIAEIDILGSYEKGDLLVYNSLGQLVYQSNLTENKIHDLSPGLYNIVYVHKNDKITLKQIIK